MEFLYAQRLNKEQQLKILQNCSSFILDTYKAEN